MRSGPAYWTGSDATHMTLKLRQSVLVFPVTYVRLAQMDVSVPELFMLAPSQTGLAMTGTLLVLLSYCH